MERKVSVSTGMGQTRLVARKPAARSARGLWFRRFRQGSQQQARWLATKLARVAVAATAAAAAALPEQHGPSVLVVVARPREQRGTSTVVCTCFLAASRRTLRKQRAESLGRFQQKAPGP